MPGWLPWLFRRTVSNATADRRVGCVCAGCPHFRRCFIERASRASEHADLVVANHALVMLLAARGRETGGAPTRLVFDEGHHLFDAADSTFAVALTGQETRSEEHTSELQSLMRISYAVFCLKKKK